jgi:DNA-directed RNA polymerase alpha subunit
MAEAEIQVVADAVAEEKAATQAAYEAALRELQKGEIDGDEFIRVRAEIERLRALQIRQRDPIVKLKRIAQKRGNELAAWENIKQESFKKLKQAAKKVSHELRDQLRVNVSFGRTGRPLSSC